MREQSLRIPWRDFAETCDQVVEWRSFALWVRAIISAARTVPDWLRHRIAERCPGFFDRQASDPDSIWVDVSAWADAHQFGTARHGGWIEAVHYYAGRDLRSERVWSHWTLSESQWRTQSARAYPSFVEWHAQALNDLAGTESELDARIMDYIEWEAFAFWARLIAESAGELPPDLSTVLERRCPGFADRFLGKNTKRSGNSIRLWRDLGAWIEDHHFAKEAANASLETLRAAARTHLRGERIAAYWAHCSSRWSSSPPASYPDFEQWLREADAFVNP
jgi:hypothetical protein